MNELFTNLGVDDVVGGLLGKCEETNFPLVFKTKKEIHNNGSPWIVIVIGPSCSGKSFFIEGFVSTGKYAQVQTATSRPKREDEPSDAYKWMHLLPSETPEMLAGREGLVEFNVHAGNVYGLPREHVEKGLEKGQNLVFLSENNGARAIMEAFPECSILTVFIMTPSMEALKKRLLNTSSRAETAEKRLQTAYREIETATESAHLIVLNPEVEGVQSALELPAFQSLLGFLEELQKE